MSDNTWIGVDLDGTLAYYNTFIDATHIGDPVPLMLERVKQWRREGIEVRIVTARAALQNNPWPEQVRPAIEAIKAWCVAHVGEELPVTAEKDFAMIELWDDRAVRVGKNTGERVL